MKLNDPFGRIAARRAKEYESLRNALKTAQVDSHEKASQVLENIRRRGWMMAVFILLSTLVLITVYPEGQIIFLFVAMVFGVWLYNTTRNGTLYVNRYIAEELDKESES